MNLTRRTWASALALTFVLGACSTPDDLVTPTLEPQFGDVSNDFGTEVVLAPNGRVFGLSEHHGEGYGEDYYGDEYYYFYDDIYLSRYDTSGKLLWSEYVSGSHDENYEDAGSAYYAYPVGMSADKNGVSYVFVAEESSWGDGQQNFVYKFNLSGTLIGTVYLDGIGTSTQGRFMSGTVDAAGNIYFANKNGSRGYVAKYTTSGTLLWKRTLSVGDTQAVTVASNGYVYVSGSTGVTRLTSSGNIIWTKSGGASEVAASGTNLYLHNYKMPTIRKLDANGKQLWSKTQTGLSNIVIGAITADANGNVYLTGKYSASSTNRNVFTRKLNSSGSVLWTKTFGTSAYDDARGIATLNGSEIYITGATQGSLAHSFRGGENDGYIRKLNSSGNPVWTR